MLLDMLMQYSKAVQHSPTRAACRPMHPAGCSPVHASPVGAIAWQGRHHLSVSPLGQQHNTAWGTAKGACRQMYMINAAGPPCACWERTTCALQWSPVLELCKVLAGSSAVPAEGQAC